MPTPNMFVLCVESPLKSAEFYTSLFEIEPEERPESFVLYNYSKEFQLGLWKKDDIQPAVQSVASGIEIGIKTQTKESLLSIFLDLENKCFNVIQPPIDMSFGHTFTIQSPEGHRIRYYSLHSEGI